MIVIFWYQCQFCFLEQFSIQCWKKLIPLVLLYHIVWLVQKNSHMHLFKQSNEKPDLMYFLQVLIVSVCCTMLIVFKTPNWKLFWVSLIYVPALIHKHFHTCWFSKQPASSKNNYLLHDFYVTYVIAHGHLWQSHSICCCQKLLLLYINLKLHTNVMHSVLFFRKEKAKSAISINKAVYLTNKEVSNLCITLW